MERLRRIAVEACPVCGAREFRRWLSLPDRFRLTETESWPLAFCKRCGVGFLQELPAAELLASCYPDDGYDPFISAGGPRSLLDRIYVSLRKLSLAIRFHRLGKPKIGTRLLDVGCGTGEFIAYAHERGWKSQGLDFSVKAVEAVKKLGFECHHGDLASFNAPAEPFHAITFWHSMEHVPNPRETLGKAVEMLADKGRIVIAVPNGTSWDARVYGENWIAYDAPRHCTMFTPDSLRLLVEECGLHVKSVNGLLFDLAYNLLHSERLLKERKGKTNWFAPFRLLWAGIPAAIGGEAGASVIVIVAEKKKNK